MRDFYLSKLYLIKATFKKSTRVTDLFFYIYKTKKKGNRVLGFSGWQRKVTIYVLSQVGHLLEYY